MNPMLKNYFVKGLLGVAFTALVGYTIKAERDVAEIVDEKYPAPDFKTLFKKK